MGKRYISVFLFVGFLALLFGCTGSGESLDGSTSTEDFSLRYSLRVLRGSGSGDIRPGERVAIKAELAPKGQVFDKWSGDIKAVEDIRMADTFVNMPSKGAQIQAEFRDKSKFPLYTLLIEGGKGARTHQLKAGERVTVEAKEPEVNQQFERWDGDIAGLQNSRSPKTELLMPAKDISIKALFLPKGKEVQKFQLKVSSGIGSGSYLAGTPVSIKANPPATDHQFLGWEGDVGFLSNSKSSVTSLVMPKQPVFIHATYKKTTIEPKPKYQLTVIDGFGSGRYAVGAKVEIIADVGHPAFTVRAWKVTAGSVESASAIKTTFTMPAQNVTATVTFKQSSNKGQLRVLMATDMLVMKDLWRLRKKDFAVWRRVGINTMYAVIDLPTGCAKARPYILPGRSETKIHSIVVKNAKIITEQGFRLMIVLGNEPSVRSGLSSCMGGLGRKRIGLGSMYTGARLAKEKAAWKDLFQKLGKQISTAALFLEPSVSSSKSFVQSLARYIRSIGFQGALYSNGIGGARWNGDRTLRVYSATSINFLNHWLQSSQQLRNSDGMMTLTGATASRYIPQMTGRPGPHGYVLWYSDYRGSSSGPGRLKDWHWKYILISDNRRLLGSHPSFSGQPINVPGRIEAERYDKGGRGRGYHDQEMANLGGHYRRGDGVDIYQHGSGYHVGRTRSGEWLAYTIQVKKAGKYRIRIRLASRSGGGIYKVEIGSQILSSVQVPRTGNSASYRTVEAGSLQLPAGVQTLRLIGIKAGADHDVANVDWMELLVQ